MVVLLLEVGLLLILSMSFNINIAISFFKHDIRRAGSSIVLHKDSPRQERWNRLKETNPLLRKLGEFRTAFDESENSLVASVRSAVYTVGSWFDENETAQVTRMMRALDPGFQREAFERELREYIVPEVVDAYLSADREALKKWCGEAVSFLEVWLV